MAKGVRVGKEGSESKDGRTLFCKLSLQFEIEGYNICSISCIISFLFYIMLLL